MLNPTAGSSMMPMRAKDAPSTQATALQSSDSFKSPIAVQSGQGADTNVTTTNPSPFPKRPAFLDRLFAEGTPSTTENQATPLSENQPDISIPMETPTFKGNEIRPEVALAAQTMDANQFQDFVAKLRGEWR